MQNYSDRTRTRLYAGKLQFSLILTNSVFWTTGCVQLGSLQLKTQRKQIVCFIKVDVL